MSLLIIHLIITTSLQLHSSFQYNDMKFIIKNRIIQNALNKKKPFKFTHMSTIFTDGKLYNGIIKPTNLPNYVLIADNESGMHFFPYYLNSEKNITLYNCIWEGKPSFETRKTTVKHAIEWFTTHFTIQSYNIDIHNCLAEINIPFLEKTWLLDIHDES